MKTFKKILSEVAQPKSAEEKRFKDQHTVELIKHPVALDSQFTGEIEGVTKKKRPADVAPGEDEAKYDGAYAVKNKPFKMPRNIDEELELEEGRNEVVKALADLAKKPGMDKKDFQKAHDLYKDAKYNDLKKLIYKLDTEPSEVIAHTIASHDSKTFNSMYPRAKTGDYIRRIVLNHPIKEEAESLEEKAVSQAQQKLMGMALALKRGEMDAADASDEVKNLAKSMSMKDLEDFASTKHDDLPKKVKKENLSFKNLINKLAEETSVDLNETPEEEIPMMMRQLHFIAYAADEIMEYLAIDGLDPEEWWQNKLAYAFAQMKSLHAYVEGDKRMMDVGDDDDNLMAAYESAISELLDSEDDEIEEITETMVNMKAGMLKLKNNKTVKLDTKEAAMLNKMFKDLNPKNKKEMHDLLTKDEKGFNEILSFAKEAGL